MRGLNLPARAAQAEGEAPEDTPRFGSPRDIQAAHGAVAGRAAQAGHAAPSSSSAQNAQYGWEATPPYELRRPAATVPEVQQQYLYEGDEYSDYDDDDGTAYTGPVEHHVL